MRSLPYRLVDVFTTEPLAGNALAVFSDAAGIDEHVMQKIAREMNLAETTFVLPASSPTYAAQVRIFTPRREMVFAGHPTIGTSFVLLEEGRVPVTEQTFTLEEKIGPVPIWAEDGAEGTIWLRTPPITEGKQYPPDLCARVLGLSKRELLPLPPQLLSAGNPTLFVALRDEVAVDRAWLDQQGANALRGEEPDPFCVFVFCRTKEGAYSRMFAPDYGVPEDPATGSSTGPLAIFLMKHGLLSSTETTRFTSEQGTKMGRRSLLHVRIEGRSGCDGIYVGGQVTPIAQGTMKLQV